MNSQKGAAHLILLFVIFLALAAGYLYFSNSFNIFNKLPESVTQPIIRSAKLNLSLDNLTDGMMAEGDIITVSGKTSPNTVIAIYSDTDQSSVESDSKGNFEGKLKLEPGINSLTVTAFGDSGDEKSLSLDVVNDS